jgi:hypothetical protein
MEKKLTTRIPWNKGLKKGDHPSMDRMGFKVGNEWSFKEGHEVKKEWIESRHKIADSRLNIKPKSARRRARNRFEAEPCEKCGRTDKIHLHHIDGNLFNNNKENIQSLCCACHNILHANWESLQRDELGRFMKKDLP